MKAINILLTVFCLLPIPGWAERDNSDIVIECKSLLMAKKYQELSWSSAEEDLHPALKALREAKEHLCEMRESLLKAPYDR